MTTQGRPGMLVQLQHGPSALDKCGIIKSKKMKGRYVTMKKYDFAFVTKEVREELKKAMQYHLDFNDFCDEYGYADWMSIYTDAADGEEMTEEECKVIDEVMRQVWNEMKYLVMSTSDSNDDESMLLRTDDLNEAKAKADYFDRGEKGVNVEVRKVNDWNWGGYNYDVVYTAGTEYYYWIDTDYHYGDYSVKKWAMIRGELTEDGEKDRDTEEVIAWGEQPYTDDIDEAWRLTDEAIVKELGFLPDYEVN